MDDERDTKRTYRLRDVAHAEAGLAVWSIRRPDTDSAVVHARTELKCAQIALRLHDRIVEAGAIVPEVYAHAGRLWIVMTTEEQYASLKPLLPELLAMRDGEVLRWSLMLGN